MTKIPVALQVYSVRAAFAANPLDTLRAVKAMGYQAVEFFGAPAYCPEFYKGLLKETGLVCCGWLWSNLLTPEGLRAGIDFSREMGNRTLICGSVQHDTKEHVLQYAKRLNETADALAPFDMRTGYHSHKHDHATVDGIVPWDVLMDNTDKEVIMQLDVGNSIDGGADVMAILNNHPGRCKTVHIKPHGFKQNETGIKPVVGEDDCPWREIIDFLKEKGNTEWYIVEYGNTGPDALETAEKCLHGLQKYL